MADEPTIVTPPSEPAALPAGSPAAAPPVTPAATPPAAPKAPPERREIIEQAFKNPGQRGQHASTQPRQDNGKFAPGAPQPPAATEPAIPARPAMPKSLKKDLEQFWNQAPVELATAVHQRELDYERGVQPLKAKAQSYDELIGEFQPYEGLMRAENATPQLAIRNLLQTAALFRTGSPAQKAQAVVQLMNQFNIPFQHVQQFLSGNPPSGTPAQSALDPQFQRLTQQVESLVQSHQSESHNRALSAVTEFSKQPENKHFDALQDRILALIQSPQVMGPDFAQKSDPEKLRLAYDYAAALDPEISKQILAEKQVASTAQQQVDKAKQAAVQVKGAPASGPAPKPNPNDRREVIRQAFNASR